MLTKLIFKVNQNGGIIIMAKKLVAYFSASGVTAKMAKALAEVPGSDLFGIQPAAPYNTADLSWRVAAVWK